MGSKFKIESGIQLLSRLTKKPNIEQFYPKIFGNGPKLGDFIEVFSESSTTCLLSDLVCEAIIPPDPLQEPDGSVVIFNTDGNLTLDYLFNKVEIKLTNRLKTSDLSSTYNMNNLETLVHSMLRKVFVFDIFEPTQFYTSIQNLENVLMRYSNIILIVFHTITAFYWCEQSFKVSKMDTYLKKILQLVKRTIKDFKVTVLYSRPEYFSSNKEAIKYLQQGVKDSLEEQIDYRIQIVYNENGTHYINVRTCNNHFQQKFEITNNDIIWL